MNIMLVEDDYVLNKVIIKCLNKNDNIVDSFLNGLDAFNNLNNQYDLFIIDIDVPDVNGIELLQKIKDSYTNAYTIMISATIDIEMIEKAYKIGCDDYIKKPFNTKELELKLELLDKKIDTNYKLAKDCFYNSKLSQIIYEYTVIDLTKKESNLLYLLLNNKGRIISSEIIDDVLWETSTSTNQVRQLVSRVNKKLPFQIIINKPGLGYTIECE